MTAQQQEPTMREEIDRVIADRRWRTDIETWQIADAVLAVLERRGDDDAARVRRVRSSLDAIIIRCREGDRRSDWLPIIDRLATEALTALDGDDTK